MAPGLFQTGASSERTMTPYTSASVATLQLVDQPSRLKVGTPSLLGGMPGQPCGFETLLGRSATRGNGPDSLGKMACLRRSGSRKRLVDKSEPRMVDVALFELGGG